MSKKIFIEVMAICMVPLVALHCISSAIKAFGDISVAFKSENKLAKEVATVLRSNLSTEEMREKIKSLSSAKKLERFSKNGLRADTAEEFRTETERKIDACALESLDKADVRKTLADSLDESQTIGVGGKLLKFADGVVGLVGIPLMLGGVIRYFGNKFSLKPETKKQINTYANKVEIFGTEFKGKPDVTEAEKEAEAEMETEKLETEVKSDENVLETKESELDLVPNELESVTMA
ncbi:hypothetical protein FACS189465_0030 [Clostridia bacterium]|nr:hypothetical protein FACS189465_0030 [Clostridia bacterium]